jgi:hypothetical protein
MLEQLLGARTVFKSHPGLERGHPIEESKYLAAAIGCGIALYRSVSPLLLRLSVAGSRLPLAHRFSGGDRHRAKRVPLCRRRSAQCPRILSGMARSRQLIHGNRGGVRLVQPSTLEEPQKYTSHDDTESKNVHDKRTDCPLSANPIRVSHSCSHFRRNLPNLMLDTEVAHRA